MTPAVPGILTSAAAVAGTTVPECARLLDQAEATGTAYLTALAAAGLDPHPDRRRAAQAEAAALRQTWRTTTAALVHAVQQLGSATP